MGPVPDDVLTVEDRFLLQIALKNQILSGQQAAQAEQELRRSGGRLEDVLLRMRLLDGQQLARLREAMAASQIVRLDTLYASILSQHRIVPPQVLQQAFVEQRRQRFRARIGQILVSRGVLTPEAHRQVITAVIRILKTEPDAYGSGVVQSAASNIAPAPAPAPPPPPPPPTNPPLISPPPTNPPRGTAATLPNIPVFNLSDISEDETEDLFRSSGIIQNRLESLQIEDDETDEHTDPFTLSAIRIGLESDDGISFTETDHDRARMDLAESTKGAVSQDSFVLDRLDLNSGESAEFQPDAYLERKRSRALLVRVVVGVVALVVLSVVGMVLATLLGNRGAVGEVRELLARAKTTDDPQGRMDLYGRAAERLASIDGLGASDDVLEELRGQTRWGALSAEAHALIAAGTPSEAKELLDRRSAEVPEFATQEHAELLREAERESHLASGRSAEARQDLAAAVLAYNRALPLGDPGGVARGRLDAIHQQLNAQMEAAYQKARTSLSRADEEAFFAAAKQISDLFNENPGAKQRLEDLRYQRALAKGREDLAAGRFAQAEASFQEALRLRVDDPDASAGLRAVGKRRQRQEQERLGNAAEKEGELEAAIEHYEKALALSVGPNKRRLDGAILRCRRKLASKATLLERRRRRNACLELMRKSKVEEAVKELETLQAEGDDKLTARLLAFARTVIGMVYVPPGKFLMGSAPADRDAKAHEKPQHQVELPGYFIGRTEVTNGEFAEFVATGKVPPPPHWSYAVKMPDGSVRTDSYDPASAEHPVVNVTWAEANGYAGWRGASLPSEPQWEKAARGTSGQLYPWGKPRRVRAHIAARPDRLRRFKTAPVGVHADDKSPYGAMDMAGNVNEWTADVIRVYPGAPKSASVPGGRRAIRGGAWRWPMRDARCAARDSMADTYRSETVGFRIVIPVPESIPPLR